jgi:hypothetical protein
MVQRCKRGIDEIRVKEKTSVCPINAPQ